MICSEQRRAPKPYRVAPRDTDFSPTEPWTVEALLQHETFSGLIWEPACGTGNISKVLQRAGYDVMSTDITPRFACERRLDFLTCGMVADNIILCPPFTQAEAFMQTAIASARRKAAILLPTELLTGVGRWERIYSQTPPTRLYLFPDKPRVRLAWYVWDKTRRVKWTKTIWLDHVPPKER